MLCLLWCVKGGGGDVWLAKAFVLWTLGARSVGREREGMVQAFLAHLWSLSVSREQGPIYGILRDVLAPVEENRKIICRIIEDPLVIERFFAQNPIATNESETPGDEKEIPSEEGSQFCSLCLYS